MEAETKAWQVKSNVIRKSPWSARRASYLPSLYMLLGQVDFAAATAFRGSMGCRPHEPLRPLTPRPKTPMRPAHKLGSREIPVRV